MSIAYLHCQFYPYAGKAREASRLAQDLRNGHLGTPKADLAEHLQGNQHFLQHG